MMKRCWILVVFFRLAAVGVFGDGKMAAEIYPLGLVDFELAEKIASGIVTSEGKLVADKARNRLILFETPERHAALRKALARIEFPIQHVRIQVAFKDHSVADSERLGVNGQIHVETGPVKTGRSGVSIQAQRSTLSQTGLVQQDLLVMSGGKARIRVGTDIPYADWFWNFGLQQGLWAGGIRWKEVGSQMAVEPYVLDGKRVRLRLTPEFSYVLNREPLITAIETLTTEVVVVDGQEIELGGLPVSNQEFHSKFLVGHSQLGEKRTLRITLKPTIETLAPPPQD